MQSNEEPQAPPHRVESSWRSLFPGGRSHLEPVSRELLSRDGEGATESLRSAEPITGNGELPVGEIGTISYDPVDPDSPVQERTGFVVGADRIAEPKWVNGAVGEAQPPAGGAPTAAEWWGAEAAVAGTLPTDAQVHSPLVGEYQDFDVGEETPNSASHGCGLVEASESGLPKNFEGHVEKAKSDSGMDRASQDAADGIGTPMREWPEHPEIERLRRLVRDADVAVGVGQNAGTVIGVQITAKFERMLERQPLDDEFLATIRSVFQPPLIRFGAVSKEYEHLLGAFIDPGSVVVLSGRPGSGRTITGLALLAHLRAMNGATVSTLSYGGAAKFSVRGIPDDERCGYLLELPTDDAEFAVSEEFGRTLYAVRDFLRRTSSHLVVITTEEQWDQVGYAAPVRSAELVAASARDIAAAWLGVLPDLCVERWIEHPSIVDLLERETPRGAMEIVGLIAKAAHTAKERLPAPDPVDGKAPGIPLPDEDNEFLRRVLSVVAARKSWRRQLLDWHRKPERTSFERNFLLAAATLREAPVGEVYASAIALARQLGDEAPSKGQRGPGIIQLAGEIEADLSGDEDRLEFPRPGWDDAVLHYFWIDRPLSREDFLRWIAQAPLMTAKSIKMLSPSSSAEDKASRAARMASFALRWAARQRRPEYLEKIVTSWFGEKDLWPAAVHALDQACFDPLIGRETHILLLNWAKRPDAAAFQQAVVEVCARDFGRAYPGKALVRLSHVAGSSNPKIAERVRQAVQTLWKEEPLSSALMAEILKWCAADEEARRAAGRQAFTALAELCSEEDETLPALVAQHQNLRVSEPDADMSRGIEDLAQGWRSIIESPNVRMEAASAGRLWFDACLVHSEVKGTIFHIFRRAVAEPGKDGSGLQHQLLDLLYDWQPTDDQAMDRIALRHALTDLLLHDGSRALQLYLTRSSVLG